MTNIKYRNCGFLLIVLPFLIRKRGKNEWKVTWPYMYNISRKNCERRGMRKEQERHWQAGPYLLHCGSSASLVELCFSVSFIPPATRLWPPLA